MSPYVDSTGLADSNSAKVNSKATFQKEVDSPPSGRMLWEEGLAEVLVSSGYCNKRPSLGGPHNRNVFLTVVKTRSLISECQQIQTPAQAPFLACRGPSSCCILTGQRERGLWSLLIRALITLTHRNLTTSQMPTPKYHCFVA